MRGLAAGLALAWSVGALAATGATAVSATDAAAPKKPAVKIVPKAKPVAKTAAHVAAKPVAHAPVTRPAAAKKPAVKPRANSDAAAAPIQNEPIDPARVEQMRTEQAAQRAQLHERLDALRRDIAAGEATRSEAADALSTSERAISDANRKLRDLSGQQTLVQGQLSQLTQRRGSTTADIVRQQTQLAAMLHDTYLSGNDDAWKLLFSGDDPNRIQRDLEYFSYVSRAQADILQGLKGNLDELQELSQQTEAHDDELAAIAQAQQSAREDLVKEEANRRDTLAQISVKLSAQRAEAGALERDEQRLGKVVEELGRVIEKQARDARERERQRQREAAAKEAKDARDAAAAKPSERPTPGHTEPVPEKVAPKPAEELPPLAFAGNFAKLRGHLHLPSRGDVVSHFGSARAEGGPSWKGIFIRAAQGTDVTAIAPGRVVFAEWLRGFGNLLIVDHGDQYLSIYGNNESLLKQPGDTVQAGDVLATVGNSGGNPETGLYFELRYQGKPFDPLQWATR